MFHFEKYNEKDEKKWDDFVMKKHKMELFYRQEDFLTIIQKTDL